MIKLELDKNMLMECEKYFYTHGILPDSARIKTKTTSDLTLFLRDLADQFASGKISKSDSEYIQNQLPIIYNFLDLYSKGYGYFEIRLQNLVDWMNIYLEVPLIYRGDILANYIYQLRNRAKQGKLKQSQIDYINSIDESILESNDSINRSFLKKIFHSDSNEDSLLNKNLTIDQLRIYNAYGIHTVHELIEFIDNTFSIKSNLNKLNSDQLSLIDRMQSDFKLDSGTDKWFYSRDITNIVIKHYLGLKYTGEIDILLLVYKSLKFEDIVNDPKLCKEKLKQLISLIAIKYNTINKKLIHFILRIYTNMTLEEIGYALDTSRQNIYGSVKSIIDYLRMQLKIEDNKQDSNKQLEDKVEQPVNQQNIRKNLAVNKDKSDNCDLLTLGLSNRSYNSLRRAGIHSIDLLLELCKNNNEIGRQNVIDTLSKMYGIGTKSINEIADKVELLISEDISGIKDKNEEQIKQEEQRRKEEQRRQAKVKEENRNKAVIKILQSISEETLNQYINNYYSIVDLLANAQNTDKIKSTTIKLLAKTVREVKE